MINGYDVWHRQSPVNARRGRGTLSVREVIDVAPLRLPCEGFEGSNEASNEASPWWVRIMKAGGLTRAQTVARMAASVGMSSCGSDMSETGLAHFAGTDMSAATPEITLGCGTYQSGCFPVEDNLQEPCEVQAGQVASESPGLCGVPDLDKVARLTVGRSH